MHWGFTVSRASVAGCLIRVVGDWCASDREYCTWHTESTVHGTQSTVHGSIAVDLSLSYRENDGRQFICVRTFKRAAASEQFDAEQFVRSINLQCLMVGSVRPSVTQLELSNRWVY